jgi:hypothetical protein
VFTPRHKMRQAVCTACIATRHVWHTPKDERKALPRGGNKTPRGDNKHVGTVAARGGAATSIERIPPR